ncbi:MAG: chorismate synthase [Bacteroidales bacterium]|nr:chorismate synthase [Bacteroidales bacterium]MBO7528754.1 chorismate synthase [Bacteroidales bacterium]
MNSNSFGTAFCLTTFGESHGAAIGGVIDGCPAGVLLDKSLIERELSRRKPGQDNTMSARKEPDEVEFLSGLFEGKTTGTPIAFLIRNKDAKTSDYENIKNVFRPSHADFTYQMKYGIRDYAGGGRGSARTLLPCVVAGAIAKQILATQDIEIQSNVIQIGEEREKDTVGAIVQGTIKNVPVGLGEPAFQKFNAVLAHAMMTINAAKGFEIGEGFNAASMRGSECNDEFIFDGERIRTKTNHSGGVQGGITNGEDVVFRVAFKPIPSVMFPQQTVDIQGNATTLEIQGRHDVCVVPRVLPMVEAMAAMVTLDFILLKKCNKI